MKKYYVEILLKRHFHDPGVKSNSKKVLLTDGVSCTNIAMQIMVVYEVQIVTASAVIVILPFGKKFGWQQLKYKSS